MPENEITEIERTTMAPILTLEEAQATVETKTAPRVTKDSITAKIEDATYFRDNTLTVCVIRMKNGFKVVGKAASALQS